jgi:hypothetical protein
MNWTQKLLSRSKSTVDGCWLWQGAKIPDGYGQLQGPQGKVVLVHRLSWQLFRGPIPEKAQVLHKCDVPSCLNPEHLFLGSQRDNILDMKAKGRLVTFSGERHGMAKLKWVHIRKIRSQYSLGKTRAQLAQEYAISWSQLNRIVKGTSWASQKNPS